MFKPLILTAGLLLVVSQTVFANDVNQPLSEHQGNGHHPQPYFPSPEFPDEFWEASFYDEMFFAPGPWNQRDFHRIPAGIPPVPAMPPPLHDYYGPAYPPVFPPGGWRAGPPAAPMPMPPPPENSAQIDVLLQQIGLLEQKLQSMQAENSQLLIQLQNLPDPVNSSHLVELSLMQASMAALTAERNDLTAQLSSIEEQNQQIQDNFTALQAQLNTLHSQQSTMEQEKNHLLQQVEQLNAERNQLQQTVDAGIQSKEQDSTALAEARNQLAILQQQYDSERQSLQGEISSLEQNLEHTQGAHHELLQTYETLKNAQNNDSSELAQAKASLTGLEQEHQQERQLLQDKLGNLQQDNQTLQQSNYDLKMAYDALKLEYDNQMRVLNETEARLGDAMGRLDASQQTVEAEIATLQQQNQELDTFAKEQRSALVAAEEKLTLAGSLDEEIASLKKQLANRNDELGALNMRFNNSQSMMTGLEAASRNARDKLAAMATEYQAMQEKVTASENESAALASTIAQQDLEINRLQEALKARDTDHEMLSSKLMANEKAHQEHDLLTTGLREKITQLENELLTRTTTLEHAETRLQQQTGQLTQLEQGINELQNCQNALSEANQQIVTLQNESGRLKQELENSNKARSDLEKRTTDSDADGVADAIDICPNTSKGVTVNSKGCEPDSDLDGLVDRLDLCPDTAADLTVDEVGCHAEQTITLEGVNFQSGSADFTAESLVILDNVADILKQFNNVKVEVAGHTDNTGPRELNIDLSATRANAVKNYLVGQGIATERLSAYGYGPDQPVASNATATGRAENRRVELRRK